VSSAVLFVAGAHQNAQITALKNDGVQVVETVTACQGLLGGSGSNAAGYSCRGTLSVGGHVYRDPVPGTSLYAPGTKLVIVVDLADPGLVSSVGDLKKEHASADVFILPSILLVLLLALGALIGVRFRSRPERSEALKRNPGVSAEFPVQKAASSPASA
jgi:hypothetical protein